MTNCVNSVKNDITDDTCRRCAEIDVIKTKKFPVQVIALWVRRKPNKEFDLPMTGSQEVLFWYECTIIFSPISHTFNPVESCSELLPEYECGPKVTNE